MKNPDRGRFSRGVAEVAEKSKTLGRPGNSHGQNLKYRKPAVPHFEIKNPNWRKLWFDHFDDISLSRTDPIFALFVKGVTP